MHGLNVELIQCEGETVKCVKVDGTARCCRPAANASLAVAELYKGGWS